MNADVSRVLARLIAELSLDRQVARELVAEFGGARTLEDLPDWVREFDPETSGG